MRGPILQRRELGAELQCFEHHGELRAIVRVGKIERIAADELLRRIPKEGLTGRRGVGAPAAGIDVGHEVGGILGEQLVARLARLECLVGELHAFGHLVERVAEPAELRRLPCLERGAGVQIAFADALGDVGELFGGPHLTEIAEQPGAADGQGDGGEREGEADEGLPVDGGEDGVTWNADGNHGAGAFGTGKRREAEYLARAVQAADDVAAAGMGAHGAEEAASGKTDPSCTPLVADRASTMPVSRSITTMMRSSWPVIRSASCENASRSMPT